MRPRKQSADWGLTLIKSRLENYVAETAMLELEPEHVRKSRQQAVYDDHQRLMTDLFDYIWTSRLWNDSVTEAFSEMLLSRTFCERFIVADRVRPMFENVLLYETLDVRVLCV